MIPPNALPMASSKNDHMRANISGLTYLKVDKIGPKDWATVDKTGRTEIMGPAKNGIIKNPAAHQKICSSLAATALRRRGNDLGTTIKYL
jgi:hypothetical protein